MSELLVNPIVDGVLTLTLNRPDKKNALSIALRDHVSDALDAVRDDPDLRCVVITGAGDVFSAGFDLKEFSIDEPGFQDKLWASSDRFHHGIWNFPLPVVAAVNGPALAGGFDLAMLCDIRIASTNARFAHPEQSWVDPIYSPYEAHLGGAVARDLCMTGRSIDADEALRMSVVTAVVEPGQLTQKVAEITAAIAQAPRNALERSKAKAIARANISHDIPTLDL